MIWCYLLGVIIAVMAVEESMGQEYCSDLSVPLDQLFTKFPKKNIRRGNTEKHESITTVDDCLRECVDTDGCYGVDWNTKRIPWRNTRCWLVVGEPGQMKWNRNVNHFRRQPCPANQIDPCESVICENGGECTEAIPGTASCDCATGFYGENCEGSLVTAQDYCSDSSVTLDQLFDESPKHHMRGASVKQHQAIKTLADCLRVCLDTDDCYGVDWNTKSNPWKDTRCWLVIGETGEFKANRNINHYTLQPCPADRIDPCEALTCQNGGECEEATSGSVSCDCADGFSGDNCEIAIITDDETFDDYDYGPGSIDVGWSPEYRQFNDATSFEVYLLTDIKFEYAGTVTEIRYFWGDYQVQLLAFITWSYVEGEDGTVRVGSVLRAIPEAGENIIDTFDTSDTFDTRVEAGDSVGVFAVGAVGGGPSDDSPPPIKALPYDFRTQDQCSPTLHVSALKQEFRANGDGHPYYKAADISSLDDCRIYSVQFTYQPDA